MHASTVRVDCNYFRTIILVHTVILQILRLHLGLDFSQSTTLILLESAAQH